VSTTPAVVLAKEVNESQRVREAIRELPSIAAQPGAKVLVVGSSTIELGFSPAAFDARMRQEHGQTVTSYNLGMGGAYPPLEALFAREIRRAFERQGQVADAIVLGFTAFQSTYTYESHVATEEQGVLMEGLMSTPGDLVRLAARSPARVGSLLADWALGEPPGRVVSLLGRRIFDEAAPSWWPGSSRPPHDDIAELVLAHDGEPPMSSWNAAFRGEDRFLYPGIDDGVPFVHPMSPARLARDRKHRIACCDVVDLRIDARMIAAFIGTVRELGAVSRRVFVVTLPRNRAWLPISAEGLRRRRDAIDRIRREAGVEVIDLADAPEFEAVDFYDTTHLNESSGRPKFSALLADGVAERMAAVAGAGLP
jgi:hypothetical protein